MRSLPPLAAAIAVIGAAGFASQHPSLPSSRTPLEPGILAITNVGVIPMTSVAKTLVGSLAAAIWLR